MKKRLAVLLLLSLVVGCGEDPAPEDPSASGDGSSQLNNQPEVQRSTGNPEPRPKEPVVVRDKEDVKAAAFTPGLFRGTNFPLNLLPSTRS